jgi:hypothetical protein
MTSRPRGRVLWVDLCVKVAAPGAGRLHVVAGTQRDKAAWPDGTRRRTINTLRRDHLADRRGRSVALRAAARNGWDRAAITHVLERGYEAGLFDLADAGTERRP